MKPEADSFSLKRLLTSGNFWQISTAAIRRTELRTMPEYYAHSLPDEPDRSNWETMREHEDRVAVLCAKFLKRIHPDLKSWGELLGRWHDIGKYSQEFQEYLDAANDPHQGEIKGRVDHSTAAAQLAFKQFSGIGKLLAYVLAGHHAGLG